MGEVSLWLLAGEWKGLFLVGVYDCVVDYTVWF